MKMDASGFLQKCGELFLDIRSKNKKNKVYVYKCTICDLQCQQLKKFSLHIGEMHLNNFGEIFEETPHHREAHIPSPIYTSINSDPLDTVVAASTSATAEMFNNEIKYEITEHAGDMEFMDSDEDCMTEAAHKKGKIDNNAQKGKQTKPKENSNDTESDESNDVKSNAAKNEANAIKKHKRCKRRWKSIDDTKLPHFIEMYKNNEVLWQVNDIAFGVAPKRDEAFRKIFKELKTNYSFDRTLSEVQNHIEFLNFIYYKERQQQLKCELDKTEFKPSTILYEKLSFLSDSQGPFKCMQCNGISQKYEEYRIHVAQHNGSAPFPCSFCELKFQKLKSFYSHIERHLGIYSYTCEVCGKGYPTKPELDWHFTSHTGAKPFLCSTCGASFRTRHNYDNHIRRHEKRFRYECNVCKKGFNLSSSFRSHVKTHLNIRDVLCNVCGKGFTAANYLQRHKLIHQKEKRYKCSVCGKAFAQDAGLRAHRKKNIDDSKLPLLIEMYKKYEVLWQVEDVAFGILPKRTETFDKMLADLKSNHDFDKNLDELQDHIDYLNYIFHKDKEQQLKCELDKTEFKPLSKFYKDLSFLSDSQGPFKCSNCNEIITKYDRYHIHVAQHSGAIPFQCRLCEMGFQKFDNYLRHVTRHLGINSYHCNVCGKGYPFKSELDWHLTSHTGIKPYLCPICGAGFRARHGYDNHIRRHEKRFRYECHICKHGFNHLCKLNTHIKSHLNIRDVICNVCGKGFTAAKYLQRHKLIHEEKKRYKCSVCGKAFAQDSGLRTHRKQHQPYAAIAQNKNLLNKII